LRGEYCLLDAAPVAWSSDWAETSKLTQPEDQQAGDEDGLDEFCQGKCHEAWLLYVDHVEWIIKEEQCEYQRKSSFLLEVDLPDEVLVDTAKNLCAVEAKDNHTDAGEENAEAELIRGVCWIHICHVEVDRRILKLLKLRVWLHLDSHIIHLVVQLFDVADREVSA